MTRQEILYELATITKPKRLIDQAIADFFNYRRKTTPVPAKGKGTAQIKVTWYDPNGEPVGNVPSFTESIDDARALFDLLHPNCAGGFSFHSGYAKATVDDGDAVMGFNPATAICLASIKALTDEL